MSAKRGLRFEPASYFGDRKEYAALQLNITTRADVGGDSDDDRIEWVLLSMALAQ